MGRPAGSRNPDFEAKREALARGVLEHLLARGASSASLRELASACGVTPPTMRHYFGGRSGALVAAFDMAQQHGAEHLLHTVNAELGGLRATFEGLLRYFVSGWRDYGVGRLNAVGISAGLADEGLGQVYLGRVLDPLLQAYEARIALHVAAGQLEVPDLRAAALQLLAPVLLALLHQDELGGGECRPLDVDALVGAQVDAFLRLYGRGDADDG